MTTVLLCDDGKVEDVRSLCEKHEFGIEMQAFHHPTVIDSEAILSAHREAVERIENRSIHAPFGDLCPGSFDPMVRNVARTRFDRAFVVAQSLGAKHIAFHHGYVPGTSGRAGWIRRSAVFWSSLIESTSSEITLHLENMLEREPTIIAEVVDSIGSEHIDVLLDIGHAHCHSDVPVLEWVRVLGHRVGYVHLHDNHGDKDEHLGLGQGSIPLEEVCAAPLEEAPNAIWAIEAEGPRIQTSISWLESAGYL